MTTTARDAFEAWYSDDSANPKAVEQKGDSYKIAQVAHGWWVWQAATLAEKRQPLTDEQIKSACKVTDEFWATSKLYCIAIARATEAAHGIKA